MSMVSVKVRRVTGVVSTAVIAGLFALALGVFAAPANANPDPYPPTAACTVSTTTADAGPGDAVTFVGSGFAAHQTVALSVPSASAALGSVTTNGSGSFSGTFTWPASVTGGSAVVQASAPSKTCSFTLVNSHSGVGSAGGSRGNASGSGSGSGLSSTGFETLTATTIALALIGSGAIFLGLARRKRI